MADEQIDPALRDAIAASLDADTALVPFLPELLQDLDDFGVRTTDLETILTGIELPPEVRALDLGCGAGTAAVILAQRYQRDVLGIDAMPAFVARGRERAARAGVSSRCRFEVADLRDAAHTARGYGMVCLLAAVQALGDLPATIAILRRATLSGGLMLVDDAYLAPGADPNDPALAGCLDRATTERALTAHGDQIVATHICDGPEAIPFYRGQVDCIARRAEALALRHPRQAHLIREYVERQRAEIELLRGPVVGALWILRRQ